MKEIKDQIINLDKELKASFERQAEEIKKHGAVTTETKTMVDKLNTALDEAKSRLDAMEVKMNRPGFGGGAAPAGNPEQKKSVLNFMRKGKANMSADERKALVEDADGEILVGEDLDRELYRELPKISVMRGLVSVRTTSSNRIRRRSINEVTVGWGKIETGNPAGGLSAFESDLDPSQAYLYIENLYGLTKLGEDELQDSDIGLEGHISDSFGRARAEAEDAAMVAGTGHGAQQPEGILTNTGVTNLDKTGSAISADDMLALEYEVPEQYAKNGAYLVNRKTELAVRMLKDTTGRYLWQPSVQAGIPATFNGHPIVRQSDVPQLPAAADAAGTARRVVIFGDFAAGYRFYDRMGMTIKRLNELYAEDDLVGFKFKARCGGGVVRATAFKVLRYTK